MVRWSILNLSFLLNTCTFLIGCMPSPFFSLLACILHGKCKIFDLISFTLRDSSMLATKMVYIWIYEITNSHVHTMLLGTWRTTDVQHILEFWLTRHLNHAWNHLWLCTLILSQHLNHAWHLKSLGTWSSLDTWKLTQLLKITQHQLFLGIHDVLNSNLECG